MRFWDVGESDGVRGNAVTGRWIRELKMCRYVVNCEDIE